MEADRVDVQIEMLENVSDKRASGDFDMLVSPNWQTVNAGDGQKYLMNRWSDGGSDNYSGYHSDEFSLFWINWMLHLLRRTV